MCNVTCWNIVWVFGLAVSCFILVDWSSHQFYTIHFLPLCFSLSCAPRVFRPCVFCSPACAPGLFSWFALYLVLCITPSLFGQCCCLPLLLFFELQLIKPCFFCFFTWLLCLRLGSFCYNNMRLQSTTLHFLLKEQNIQKNMYSKIK